MSLMFQSCLSSSIGLVERAQLGSRQASYLWHAAEPIQHAVQGLPCAKLRMQGPFLAFDEVCYFTEHSWPANLIENNVDGMSGSHCRYIYFEAESASLCVWKSVYNPATLLQIFAYPRSALKHNLRTALK